MCEINERSTLRALLIKNPRGVIHPKQDKSLYPVLQKEPREIRKIFGIPKFRKETSLGEWMNNSVRRDVLFLQMLEENRKNLPTPR